MHQVSATQMTASPIPSSPRDLGLVRFDEICELLDMSRPTLERLVRKDASFPRLRKIGRQRYGRIVDLQRWVDATYGAEVERMSCPTSMSHCCPE